MYLPVPTTFFDNGVTFSRDVSLLDANFAYTAGKVVSVTDFGAKGDGVTDDTAAILAAIAYCQSLGPGTRLWFPNGTFLITIPITISGVPIRLIGNGMGMGLFGLMPSTLPGTTIKYAGSLTTSAMIAFSGLQASHGMEHMRLDANNLCGSALTSLSGIFGKYDHLNIAGATTHGIISGSSLAVGSTNSWNEWSCILVNQGGTSLSCLHVTGDPSTNSAHNTWRQFTCNYGGPTNASSTHGIILGNCDNNRFYDTMMNIGPGGDPTKSHGVFIDTTDNPGFPESNIFFHLQAGAGGWSQTAGTSNWNIIFDYDMVNGQPAPNPNGGKLLWMDNWGNWNTIIGGGAGAAGGADIRTLIQVQNAFAGFFLGYQGTAQSFFDCDNISFRNSAELNPVTKDANGVFTFPSYITYGTGTPISVFSKSNTLAANAALTLTGSNDVCGEVMARDITDGGVGKFVVDGAAGTIGIVSDQSALYTTADPGPGGNKFWLHFSGGNLLFTNRFASSKLLAVSCSIFNSIPS